MKLTLFCCLTLTLIYECINRVNAGVNNGLTPRYTTRGLNTLPAYRGYGFPYPRRVIQAIPKSMITRYLPVPVVKKVTHHHIHHVIAHKGVVKNKFSNEANNGFDLDNGDLNKNDNNLSFKDYKEANDLRGDFTDNGVKSAFNKRGGRPVTESFGNMGSLSAKGAIKGYIGGQKAEFVPVIIGIIDDSNLKSGSDSNKEFSNRKGLVKDENIRREYIPSKETIKLFEDLAKLGF